MRLRNPTIEFVTEECEEFDRENALGELALKELLDRFPNNTEVSHVLLKVVAINQLYRTNIFHAEIVAGHVASSSLAIDSLLNRGAPNAVDLIADVTINGRMMTLFSFATKYCSWHNSNKYPIFDRNVDACLWAYKKQDGFVEYGSEDFCSGSASYRRENFFKVITAFRDQYHLNSLSLKQLDKFLYRRGIAIASLKNS